MFDIDKYLHHNRIARYIRKKSYEEGWTYNPNTKTVELKRSVYTNRLHKDLLGACYDFFEIDEQSRNTASDRHIEKFITRVQESTSFEPVRESRTGSVVPDKVDVFQHVVFREGPAETSLLSLGRGMFLVLATDRTTLLAGDIITAITMPWSVDTNHGLAFKIKRGEDVDFIPDDLEKTIAVLNYKIDYKFKTKPVTQLWFCEQPDIYGIVDSNLETLEESPFEARELTSLEAVEFVGYVQRTLDSRDLSPDNFMALSKYAIEEGVGAYVLNMLVMCYANRQLNSTRGFHEADWESNIPKEVLAKMEAEKRVGKEQEHKALTKAYKENLKLKVKQGRYLVLFKRSGYFTKQSEQELKMIQSGLEKLADEGIGLNGWAANERSNFLSLYKVSGLDNVVTALKLFGGIVLVAVSVTVFIQSKRSIERLEKAHLAAEALMAQNEFNRARDAYIQAYEQYTPRVTVFVVQGLFKERLANIEDAIDAYVSKGIRDINTFLTADNGRFKAHTETYLMNLLELRPHNKELQALKEKWLKQF